PLGVEALEVADEEHAEVDARRDGVAADVGGVVLLAEVLGEAVEAVVVEELVELVIEDMAGGLRQVGSGDPKFGLVFGGAAAHTHGRLLRRRCWPAAK